MTTLTAIIVLSLANAAPVMNGSQHDLASQIAPPFVPEPKGRGTFRLFSSCVITLVICVWTAVHPNIIENPTTPRRFGNKAIYVVLGLFSPEIVLAVAFNEWRASQKILQEARLAGAVAYAEHEIIEANEYLRKWDKVRSGKDDSEAAASKLKDEANIVEPIHGEAGITQTRTGNLEFEANAYEVRMHDPEAVAGGASCGTDRIEPVMGEALANTGNVEAKADKVEAWNIGVEEIADETEGAIDDDAGAKGYGSKGVTEPPRDTRERLRSKLRALRIEAQRAVSATKEPRDSSNQDSDSQVSQKVRVKWSNALTAARRVRAARMACEIYEEGWAPTPFKRLIKRFSAKWIVKKLFPADSSVYEYSRECSYFAVMGGYTICPLDQFTEPNTYNEPDTDSRPEYIISPDGFTFLLRQQIITTHTLGPLKREVLDKGKSDMLAKLLVCMQVSWMMINCGARRAAGLPITLLELNVSMHVICAVAVYILWWKKPHDAGRPISLSPLFQKSGMCELIYAISNFGSDLRISENNSVTPPSTPRVVEVSQPRITPTGNVTTPSSQLGNIDDSEFPAPDYERGFTLQAKIKDKRELNICAVAACELRKTTLRQLVKLEEDKRPWAISTPKVELLTEPFRFRIGKDLAWLLLPLCLMYSAIHASAWQNHFPTSVERLLWRVSCVMIGAPGLGAIAIWFVERLFSPEKTFQDSILSSRPQASDPPSTESEASPVARLRQMVHKLFTRFELTDFGILTAAIGVIILAAGVGAGAVYALMSIIRLPHHTLRTVLLVLFAVQLVSLVWLSAAFAVGAFIKLLISVDWTALGIVIAVPLTILYCAARGYIVVESFLSLRSLPEGAYETISWDDILPHL